MVYNLSYLSLNFLKFESNEDFNKFISGEYIFKDSNTKRRIEALRENLINQNTVSIDENRSVFVLNVNSKTPDRK